MKIAFSEALMHGLLQLLACKILSEDTAEQPAAIKSEKTVSKSFDF